LRTSPTTAVYRLQLSNATSAAIDGLLIQFNKNAAGLAPRAAAIPLPAPGSLRAGATGVEVDVPLSAGAEAQTDSSKGQLLEVAVRTNQLGVFYFDDAVPVGF
jgi:AP-1 complex subunit beta-1